MRLIRYAMSVYGNGYRSAATCRSNVGSGDLAGAAIATAVSGSRSTSVAVMDSKYRPNVTDHSRTSGTASIELTEVSSSGTDRREAASDDLVATKEVEVRILPVYLKVALP